MHTQASNAADRRFQTHRSFKMSAGFVVKRDLEIRAIRDVGCLSAAKFSYHFQHPIPHEVRSAFNDCNLILREFSKTIRAAKDLLSIKRPGEFSAEFIVGGTRAVVYFNGSAKRLPRAAIDAFAVRLQAAGFGRIVYSDGPRPRCDRCPAGLLKGCTVVKEPPVGGSLTGCASVNA